jgi:beta-1,4-mannosyl-glycoprotein beta-1,4-N-acetylglucosaminyltransferase
MLLFDNFLFNGERIVQMRLAYMHNFVDHFFLCEKRYTYQGKRKETLYIESCKEWFAPYLEKITFLVDESEPFENTWENEFAHRNYSQQHIQSYGDARVAKRVENIPEESQKEKYMVIVADVDEIPNMHILYENRYELYAELEGGIVVLNQLQYYYNLHWVTHISTAAFLISDTFMKKEPDFKTHRGRKGTVTCEFDCGWHFSFFMTRDEIRRKLESFSHTECNREEFKTDEKIDQCFFEGKDLFDREYMNACMKREEPTVKDYPAEIYEFHEYIKSLQQRVAKDVCTSNTK